MRKALIILADLVDGDLDWFADVGHFQTVSAGTVLIERGKPIDALYLVIDGQLSITAGNAHHIAEIACGDIVGEMSFIEKRPPTVSVTAQNVSKVLAIPQDIIRARLESDPPFAARFYRAIAVFLSERLRSTVSHLGYGTDGDTDEQTRFENENELDDGLLDTLLVAGDRMRRLMTLLDDKHV